MAIIEIFTDGSCHTQLRIGAWASILIIDNQKTTLSGYEKDTTHNRMELKAVIKALEFVMINGNEMIDIKLVSDSQYVIGLKARKEKFILKISWVKIKAHQKKSDTINYNREVDILARKIVREQVDKKSI